MPPKRRPPFKPSSRSKASSRSVTSSRSHTSRRTSGGSSTTHHSRASISGPSQPRPRAHIAAQPRPFVSNSASIRAPSESVARDEQDHTLNEVVMAVDLTPKGTVGCCYYVARDEMMFFMEDIQIGDVDVADALRMYIDPTIILVSTKIDDSVIDRFDPKTESGDSLSGDNDQFRLPFLLEVRPPSEFLYDAARSKLVNLHLGEEDGTRVSFNVPGELNAGNHLDDESVAGQQGQLLRLAGWIDVESRVTVSPHVWWLSHFLIHWPGWLLWSINLIPPTSACRCLPSW
jgi:DNA mismatch repair protein MSH5